MLAISTISSPAAIGYLISYIFIVSPLLFLLLNGRTSSPKTISTLKKISPTQLAIAALLLLNLAGLPPLGGFCLKAVRLTFLVSAYPLASFVLILSSVATLGFYIHVTLLAIITTFQTLTPLSAPSPLFNLVLGLGTLRSAALPIIPILMF